MSFCFSSNLKIRLFSILLMAIMFSNNFIFLAKAIQHQEINSPYINQQYGNYAILNRDCTKAIEYGITIRGQTFYEVLCATLEFYGDIIEIFSYFEEPKLEKDEILFAKLVDKEKGTVDYAYLKNFEHSKLKMPYHSDFLELFFYKQKVTDPAFSEKEENFIGRTKVFVPHEEAYRRENGASSITKNVVKGNSVAGEENIFLARTIPNYYTILTKWTISNFSDGYGFKMQKLEDDDEYIIEDDTTVIKDTTDYGYIGLIVLKDTQKDLLKPEEKIVPISYYYEETTPRKMVFSHSFYIPPEVSEFDFYVYGKKIEDSDLKRKYSIKLNRK